MQNNPHMENIIKKKSAFQHLLDISIQLNSEKNNDVLMEKILLATIDISNADAGSIYLVNKNNIQNMTSLEMMAQLHQTPTLSPTHHQNQQMIEQQQQYQ